MTEPKYTAAEQRKRMADFERHVKKARAAWKRGHAYVILSFEEYLPLRVHSNPDSRSVFVDPSTPRGQQIMAAAVPPAGSQGDPPPTKDPQEAKTAHEQSVSFWANKYLLAVAERDAALAALASPIPAAEPPKASITPMTDALIDTIKGHVSRPGLDTYSRRTVLSLIARIDELRAAPASAGAEPTTPAPGAEPRTIYDDIFDDELLTGATLPPCGCRNPDMCLKPSPGVTCAAGLIPDAPSGVAALRERAIKRLQTEIENIEAASDGGAKGVQCLQCAEWDGEHTADCAVTFKRELLALLTHAVTDPQEPT